MASSTYRWGVTLITLGLLAIPGGKSPAPAWQIPVSAPTFESFASLSLVPPAALLAYNWREPAATTRTALTGASDTIPWA